MALMTDKRYKGLNMQDISAMVGFSNRQSFYSAFYKVNGITPLTYRKQQLKKTEEKKEK
jgi:AraC-like DNA-binding protein